MLQRGMTIVFFCLCIGLKNANGGPLIDNEKDPWAKQPADVKKPKLADHLKPEILQQSALFVTFALSTSLEYLALLSIGSMHVMTALLEAMSMSASKLARDVSSKNKRIHGPVQYL
jgi:hypothetical protein